MSKLRRPNPRYGWAGRASGSIQIGSIVCYVPAKDTPDNAPDEDYSLRGMVFDPGSIEGEVTDGPDKEDGLEMWEVEWQGVRMPDGLSVDLWWTYMSVLELV